MWESISHLLVSWRFVQNVTGLTQDHFQSFKNRLLKYLNFERERLPVSSVAAIREYKLKHCDIVVKASFSYFCVTHTTPLSQLLLELHKSLTEFTCLSSSLFTSFSAAVSPHPSTTIYTFFSLKKNLFKRSWTHNRGLSSQLINNSWKKSPFFLILPPFFVVGRRRMAPFCVLGISIIARLI